MSGGTGDGFGRGPISERPRLPWRVLLAEDDPDLRALIRAALSHDGYEVVDVADGAEVLDRLQNAIDCPLTLPDVIVMDVIMPGYSGLGVLTALRRASWTTPVIMMSAIDEPSIAEKARVLGATAFFKKPFKIDDLRTAVVNASISGRGAWPVGETRH